MRVGFLDCRTNSKDAYSIFSPLVDQQANVQAVRLTAPNPFKVPAACRKLFAQGVDAVIAAVTTESDNEHEMSFMRDKVADVEILESKYVFLVIEDVHVRDEQLAESLSRALRQALEYLPAEPVPTPSAPAGMDMFSEAASIPPAAKGQEEEEVNDFLGEGGGHKLF
ncbi:hypothetical protein HYV43_05435 [Candidatus Micrarchaeota archaeon]|nr:hypothetical protein [Candidatus Micrarchaeota archaeon]